MGAKFATWFAVLAISAFSLDARASVPAAIDAALPAADHAAQPVQLAYTFCGEVIRVVSGHGTIGNDNEYAIVGYENLTCWIYSHFYN